MSEQTRIVSIAETALPKTFLQKVLDGIERVGNKVPHPAVIFFILTGLVIVLSHLFHLLGTSVDSEVVNPQTHKVEHATATVNSLLSANGIRFMLTSMVRNFANFGPVGIILVVMIGVGLAEQAGLMTALIKKIIQVMPRKAVTWILVTVGVLASIAVDAGYLILIPLGAAAFLSLGRHPLAGLAAAYAGVSAVFAVNVLITPIDSLVTEITNETLNLVPGSKPLNVTANLWFSIASTFFIALVVTLVTERLIEPRLGKYEPELAAGAGPMDVPDDDDQAKLLGDESRGLRFTLWGVLASIAVIVLLVAPPGAPLRDPQTDAVIGNTPFMDSLIFLITLIFLVAGICYGWGARTINTDVGVINAIQETFASLAGLIFMLLLISQFIAYFNFSNMPTVVAAKMADLLERADVGAIWLLILFILVIALLDIIIPGVVPKWAIFAPIFIPLFYRLGVAPQTVLAAYRVGDSPMNVITPLMVYLPFIVVVAQRYKKDAGLGTVISLMLPYTIVTLVVWTAFYVVWYLIGVPFGPGYPVQL